MKPLFIAFSLSFLFICQTAKSQSVTDKDFRLMIDGKLYADSVNIISAADLLKMQTVTANFSWITVRSIVMYYQKPFCGAEVWICSSNTICMEVKRLMKKVKPGYVLGITTEDAVNKQGIKVNIQPLAFKIK